METPGRPVISGMRVLVVTRCLLLGTIVRATDPVSPAADR
jgi:hypothetical protein